MKIAFFNYLMLEYGGGTARFFVDASLGLKQKYPHLDISIVTLDKSLTEIINRLYSFYFQRNVSGELRISTDNLRERLKKSGISYTAVRSFKELRNKLREFDSVYSKNDILEAFILKFFVGYRNLKKVIFGFHTAIYYERVLNWQGWFHNKLYGSFFYRFLIKKAKKFHVLNSFDEKRLNNLFRNKVVRKIYNPLPSFWQAGETSASRISKRIIDSGQARVTSLLWVGRLTREKGADDFIKLIRSINESSAAKKIIWTVVGMGELGGEIKNLALEFDNIKYLGYIDNQNLAEIYEENDLFLSTSRWESFPYTFLEAQCFGLPIISYNIHGCNEIIKDGVNGYLVNSLEEYRDKLLYLVQNQKEVIKKNKIKKLIRDLINNEDIYKKFYVLFTNK